MFISSCLTTIQLIFLDREIKIKKSLRWDSNPWVLRLRTPAQQDAKRKLPKTPLNVLTCPVVLFTDKLTCLFLQVSHLVVRSVNIRISQVKTRYCDKECSHIGVKIKKLLIYMCKIFRPSNTITDGPKLRFTIYFNVHVFTTKLSLAYSKSRTSNFNGIPKTTPLLNGVEVIVIAFNQSF